MGLALPGWGLGKGGGGLCEGKGKGGGRGWGARGWGARAELRAQCQLELEEGATVWDRHERGG